MMNIAICDDSKPDINNVLNLIYKYQITCDNITIRTRVFYKWNNLLELIAEGEIFGLILLNVIMPNMNGINLARFIREYDETVPIIFMSGTPLYAIDSYRVNAADYLIKPIEENDIFLALDKIRALPQMVKRLYIPSLDGGNIAVPYDDITQIEVTRGIVRVFLPENEVLNGERRGITFTSITTPLTKDNRFVKATEACMINMEHVKSLTDDCFIMYDGEAVPIAKTLRSEVMRKYQYYLLGRQYEVHNKLC